MLVALASPASVEADHYRDIVSSVQGLTSRLSARSAGVDFAPEMKYKPSVFSSPTEDTPNNRLRPRSSFMATHLLYSTNPYMKFFINENFRGGKHYIWFSENFDSGTLGRYMPGSMVPATSNPKDIYLDLKKAVDKPDTHNAKITQQISGLTALAVQWESAGEITSDQKDDIIFIVNEGKYFNYWKPLLYVIPKALVSPSRIKKVPMASCAGLGNEYIIEDLRSDEFGIIEL